MKKILVLLSVLCLFSGISFAQGRTFATVVDNTSRSLDNLYVTGGGTWLKTVEGTRTVRPSAVYLTVSGAAVRWTSGGKAATNSLGHVINYDNTLNQYRFEGADFIEGMRFNNAVAADNATITISPLY